MIKEDKQQIMNVLAQILVDSQGNKLNLPMINGILATLDQQIPTEEPEKKD